MICLPSGQTHKKCSIQHQYLLAKFWGLHVLLRTSCAKPVPRICASYKSAGTQGARRSWTLDHAGARSAAKNRAALVQAHCRDALFGRGEKKRVVVSVRGSLFKSKSLKDYLCIHRRLSDLSSLESWPVKKMKRLKGSVY